MTFLRQQLGAEVTRQPADGRVGRHRRAAVELALGFGSPAVLYSDLDRALRWMASDTAELASVLDGDQPNLPVVGRSAQAKAACPARLRDTEAIVNHIDGLVTGRAWDLMFATGLMSRRAVDVVVNQSQEDSIASDLEWPLLVEEVGLSVGYTAAHGLSYRTAQDFGADSDVHDADPTAWIERLQIAHLHAQAIARFCAAPSSRGRLGQLRRVAARRVGPPWRSGPADTPGNVTQG